MRLLSLDLSKIGRREELKGVTRFALSEEDGKVRDLLVSWMEENTSSSTRIHSAGSCSSLPTASWRVAHSGMKLAGKKPTATLSLKGTDAQNGKLDKIGGYIASFKR